MAKTAVYQSNPRAVKQILALAAPLVAKAAASAYHAAAASDSKSGVAMLHPVEFTGKGRPRAAVSATSRMHNALERGLMAARI